MKPNATQRLAALILEQNLDVWVASRRNTGTGWDRIATELAVATQGQIVTSGKTLCRWYAEAVAA